MIWTWFPFIRSGQNHLARHSERGKNTRQAEEEVGRHQGMDRPGVHQVPEGSGEQRKMEETGCEVICGAQTTPAVKGYVKVKGELDELAVRVFSCPEPSIHFQSGRDARL